ncbi:MAG: hypothetical protein CVU42_13695 [Chloroflexi bacterium HGW-Chloroflexi-4]|jgi:hypothetical protein|nr:MAG: hypothetical protein CVU42_13695 [Chloroflexi bacterium HGW-Chloroflexi-4]
MAEEIKELVVEEFEIKEKEVHTFEPGHKYSVFKDPKTGKFYRPKDNFIVRFSGEGDLNDRFVELDQSTVDVK